MLSVRYTFLCCCCCCCCCFLYINWLCGIFHLKTIPFFGGIRYISFPFSCGKMGKKTCNFFEIFQDELNAVLCVLQPTFKPVWQQISLLEAARMVKITRESRYTQNFIRNLLQNKFSLRPVKRATRADFVAKKDWCWTSLIRGWYKTREIAT